MTICFVAGKSGGHILPCLTQATHIQQQNPQTKLYLFSSGGDLDHKIMKKYPSITHVVPTELDNPPYQQPWLLPWFACKTAWYFVKSVYYLYSIKADKVVSFGGFVSVPTCLAAKVLGIPIELYELNVEPGKTTKLLSKITPTIHTCFETTKNYFPKNNCILTPYPIRFTEFDRIFDAAQLFAKYNLQPGKMTVLILGGSQGSILLNQTFKDLIIQNPEIASRIQVIHQTGSQDPFDYSAFYTSHFIPSYVFNYCEQLQDFYNIADIIICRAGAGTLFEIDFFGKTCITVPHETPNTNHQIKNVLELQSQKPDQFYIIEQSKLCPASLVKFFFK